MTVDFAERAKQGYQLGKDEGDAFYLLGMLEIVKISGRDTNGAYGLMEVTARGRRRLAVACAPRGGRVVLRAGG
jgi:hypothetical protein